MIIKVKTSHQFEPGAYWRIFADVTGLQYGKCMKADPNVPMGAISNEEIREDDVNRFNYCSTNCSTTQEGYVIDSEPHIQGVFLSFYEDGHPTEIFTNHECYLMNDNGKTIEQLHD